MDEFEQVWNPANCEIWVLEYMPGSTYQLKGRWRATPYGGSFNSVKSERRGPGVTRSVQGDLRRLFYAVHFGRFYFCIGF